MSSLHDILSSFLDTLTGHMALTAYLLAVTDEKAVLPRLKKWPVLLLSPAIAVLLSMGLYTIPAIRPYQYFILSFAVLLMCTLWVRWAWQFSFWQAFAAACMAGIFQVADATLTIWLFDENTQFAAAVVLHLAVSIPVTLLLYRLGFGKWFRLLLDGEAVPWRTALLLFALEASMELFLRLARGVQSQYLPLYYLLVAVMVILMAVLVVYLGQRFDTARKIQAQRDVIAQQRLYEQDLESIRREVRAFRHDYKNLLAGLAQQVGEGELAGLRRTLSEMEAGFDQRLGKQIQASTQIGNLQIPEVRSLLLSKLTAMRERRVECRLEALYPVEAVAMDVWDFVRCLGVLLDNAMEAALDTEQPWVEIVLLARDGRVFARVSNSCTNSVDLEKIWKEGWSTKGASRGVGLSGYQRILESYPNASACTSWADGAFVQELTVEGRP